MPPAGTGIWQTTPAALRDRGRVLALAERAGELHLVWTARDLRRELRRSPHLALQESRLLFRHLRQLAGTAFVRVDRGERPAPADGAPETRDVACYVLTHRMPEFRQSPLQCLALTDRERVATALWVATRALGQPVAPTVAVTRVLQHVDGLHLRTPAQTHVLLERMAARTPPMVARVEDAEDRAVRWRPLGDAPEGAWVQPMVAQVRALIDGGTEIPPDGYASRNALVRTLVEHAIQWTRGEDWPKGRVVTAADIRACAAADHRARALYDRLRARGRSLGVALNDATRRSASPDASRTPPITKHRGRAGWKSIYYDVPAVPGAEDRLLVVAVREYAWLASDERLVRLDRERREAEALAREVSGSGGAALSALRLFGLGLEVSALVVARQAMERVAPRLGPGPLAVVRERDARIRAAHRLATVWDDLGNRALHASVPFGGNPYDIITRGHDARLTAREYVAFCPPRTFGADSPATVLARATTLTRYANAVHRPGGAGDAREAAVTLVDRPQALVYLAEQTRGKVHGWLAAGLRLLGLTLRDARVIEPLLDHESPRVRQMALAALVLLDAPNAGDVAAGWLERPDLPADTTAAVLYALLVLRRVQPSTWPAHVRTSPVPVVRAAVRDVAFAAREGRWLCQPR